MPVAVCRLVGRDGRHAPAGIPDRNPCAPFPPQRLLGLLPCRRRGVCRGSRLAPLPQVNPSSCAKGAAVIRRQLLVFCRPCKPGSVPETRVPGPCHLSTTAVTRRLQQPTPRHRTSSPRLPVYTVLQPAGRTAGRHRCPRGGLLPRLFTLTGRETRQAVVLCYAPIPSRISSR